MAVSKVDAANQIENQLPQANIANNVNFRNMFTNGAQDIAQRGTSDTGNTSSLYLIDRMYLYINGLGTWDIIQSTTVPSGEGFSKSTKIDCNAIDSSPAAGDELIYMQRFEGQFLQHLRKGTSNSKATVLSFWVKSNKTGTYICEIYDNDNTRQISKSYTINTADTWEKKTISFAGDTSGTLDNDNAQSLQVGWWLGAGSNFTSGTLNTSWDSVTSENRAVGQVNLGDSTSNEWLITGIQWEVSENETASDFEFLPYDVNLNRCLRYFEKIADGGEDADGVIGSGGYIYQTNVLGINYQWYPKRSTPSIYQTSGTSYFRFQRSGGTDDFNQVKLYIPNYLNGLMYSDDGISGSANTNGWVQINNASAYLGLNAEL